MAFAFTVGTSDDVGANSYASVQEWIDAFPEGTDGADLSAIAATTLQRHLVNATRFIDQLPWNGRPKYEDNQPRLALPRYDLLVGPGNPRLREGDTLPSDELPWVVRDAVILLAEAERVSGQLLWRPKKDRDQVLSKKRSITGSSKEYADPLAARRYPEAAALVRGLHSTLSTPTLLAI